METVKKKAESLENDLSGSLLKTIKLSDKIQDRTNTIQNTTLVNVNLNLPIYQIIIRDRCPTSIIHADIVLTILNLYNSLTIALNKLTINC